jgi:pimeloyl-ACP methyl ester carboxylesterase
MSRARQTVYCHGMPGSPDELALFSDVGDVSFILAPNRTLVDAALSHDDLIEVMVGRIVQRFPAGHITLIGFSLGGFHALHLASRLGDRVEHLHLISAAGPVDNEELLDRMAGGAVFRMAARRPKLFAAITRFQAALAFAVPSMLIRILFASARGADRELAASAPFRKRLQAPIRSSFAHGATAYRREISAYMKPWRGLLGRVRCPVTLWHGEEDSWSPIAMAEDLQASLPGPVTLNRFAGLSHYSTLRVALKELASHDPRDKELSLGSLTH